MGHGKSDMWDINTVNVRNLDDPQQALDFFEEKTNLTWSGSREQGKAKGWKQREQLAIGSTLCLPHDN